MRRCIYSLSHLVIIIMLDCYVPHTENDWKNCMVSHAVWGCVLSCWNRALTSLQLRRPLKSVVIRPCFSSNYRFKKDWTNDSTTPPSMSYISVTPNQNSKCMNYFSAPHSKPNSEEILENVIAIRFSEKL